MMTARVMDDATVTECDDRLKFKISSVGGSLVFSRLMVDPVEMTCREKIRALEMFLVGKPLEEIDLDELAVFKCDKSATCFNIIVDLVIRYIDRFKAESTSVPAAGAPVVATSSRKSIGAEACMRS